MAEKQLDILLNVKGGREAEGVFVRLGQRVKELNQSSSKSGFTDFISLVRGGGVATAFMMIGNSMKQIAGAMKEFDEGQKTFGEMADDAARMLPVFGGLYAGARDLKYELSGARKEINLILADAKRMDSVTDAIGKMLATTDATGASVSDRMRKYAQEMALLRASDSMRPILQAQFGIDDAKRKEDELLKAELAKLDPMRQLRDRLTAERNAITTPSARYQSFGQGTTMLVANQDEIDAANARRSAIENQIGKLDEQLRQAEARLRQQHAGAVAAAEATARERLAVETRQYQEQQRKEAAEAQQKADHEAAERRADAIEAQKQAERELTRFILAELESRGDAESRMLADQIKIQTDIAEQRTALQAMIANASLTPQQRGTARYMLRDLESQQARRIAALQKPEQPLPAYDPRFATLLEGRGVTGMRAEFMERRSTLESKNADAAAKTAKATEKTAAETEQMVGVLQQLYDYLTTQQASF